MPAINPTFMKYVGALEEMLVALRKSLSKPTAEMLTEYTRKVDFLKGLLEAEKLSSPTEKALANQFLAPRRTPTIANERMPVSKTVHMQTKARCTGEMRDKLLGTGVSGKGMSDTDLRNRRGLPLDERQSAAELEAILQHHHNLQEKLAEDMLHLARNLKNNTLAAQNIIKQDNQVTAQTLSQYSSHCIDNIRGSPDPRFGTTAIVYLCLNIMTDFEGQKEEQRREVAITFQNKKFPTHTCRRSSCPTRPWPL
ncbi:vesicle transport protein USE1-like [Sander lucioperca]|uniref:vesicle transport protein USE1-like n=1 Tax=Sander lucioperca TaxID=283035 RepID=UPI001653A1D9|nr:vesicle transport protein USE1-like [Sander lucioperca]